MANILTTARRGILAALEGDAQIAGLVKTWARFEGKLLSPLEIAPQDCTVYALYPGGTVEPDQVANAFYNLEQHVGFRITAEGDDPEPCEELVELTHIRVRALDDTALGMSDEGLMSVRSSATIQGYRDLEQKWLMWQATGTIRVRWMRRN